MKKTGHQQVISGEGIVCLSSIDWDFIWQQNQEIMSRFAKAGTPVLFIENTGVRAPGLRDVPRLFARLRNWWRGTSGFREVAPNLIVLSPMLLPFPYSRPARWVNERLLSRSIESWMRATRRNAPVLWTFLPTPLVHDVIDAVEPSLIVYYYTADFAASSGGAGAVRESEDSLLRRADLVFVTSKALRARALEFRGQALFMPMGVDFESFERHRAGPPAEPPDLAAIPHPRLAYVGGLHQWIDYDLLKSLAESRPDWHLVLIGPRQVEVAALEGRANVHLLGTRDFAQLPGYLAGCDAGLIPYRLAQYTESVYPTKLNEYLAAGLPVISTPLPEVVDYDRAHPGTVLLAADGPGFAAQAASAWSAGAGGAPERIAAARRNGWDRRVAEMATVMAASLEAKGGVPALARGVIRRLAERVPLRAAAAGALACYLLLTQTSLVWRAAETLRVAAEPSVADAIVVLAGGAGEGGSVGRSHEERVAKAVELYKAGYAPLLLLCSGERRVFMELDVMRGIALAHGVPADAILTEERGGGTAAMVADAVVRARASSWRKVLLVSSPYHLRRAALTWRKAGPEVAVVPVAIDKSRFYRYPGASDPWRRRGATLAQARAVAFEFAALAFYRFKGWL